MKNLSRYMAAVQALLSARPYLSHSLFFGLGVGYDWLTLTRIDSSIQLAVQALFISALWLAVFWGIVEQKNDVQAQAPLEHVHDANPGTGGWNWTRIYRFLLRNRSRVQQFLQGSLLSAYVILFSRSAGGLDSFLFLLFLAVLLVLNELPQFSANKTVVHFSMATLCTFAYAVYVTPILLGRIQDRDFYTAIVAVFGMLLIVILALGWTTESFRERFRWQSFGPSILIIPAILSTLYAYQLIPPVPLSAYRSGVYHNVQRNGENYELVKYDSGSFWHDCCTQNIAVRNTDRVYAFVQTFAPEGFRHKLTMIWSHWDLESETFKVTDRIPVTVWGGKDTGFRGYSYKAHHKPGGWRVDVVLEDGRLMHRLDFAVLDDPSRGSRTQKIHLAR